MPLLTSLGLLNVTLISTTPSNYNPYWFTAYGNNIPFTVLGFKVLGNYIYGYGFDQATGNNLHVVKINPITGELVWYKVFGTISGIPLIYDVAVDSNDNVYLGIASGNSYALIIKLDSNGSFVSSIKYGSSDAPDFLVNMVLDKTNNVLYVGYSLSSGTTSILIKIDIATMTTIWKNRISVSASNTVLRSLTMDSLGNVYGSYTGTPSKIIKFDSTGAVVWAKSGIPCNRIYITQDVLYCYTINSSSVTNIVIVDISTGTPTSQLASSAFKSIQGVITNYAGNLCVLYNTTTTSPVATNKLTLTTSGTVVSNITYSGSTDTILLGNDTNYNQLGSFYSFTYMICLINNGTTAYYGIVKVLNDGNQPLNTPYNFTVNTVGTLSGNILSTLAANPTITTPAVPAVSNVTIVISSSVSTETTITDSTSTDVPTQYLIPLV